MTRTQDFTVMLQGLALELGVDQTGLRRIADRMGVEFRLRRIHPDHKHKVVCLQCADAERLRHHHETTQAEPEEVMHWLSAEEAARALRLTVKAFHLRRASGSLRGKIRSRRLHGPGILGNQARYEPNDVAREAALIGIRPSFKPRGTVSTDELARIVHRSRSVGPKWVRAGCPHIVTVSNGLYFRLPDVLTWVTARCENRSLRMPPHLRAQLMEARDHLAAHLTGAGEAAA